MIIFIKNKHTYVDEFKFISIGKKGSNNKKEGDKNPKRNLRNRKSLLQKKIAKKSHQLT